MPRSRRNPEEEIIQPTPSNMLIAAGLSPLTPRVHSPFPLARNSVCGGQRSLIIPGGAVPPRVLLVDDNTVIRRLSNKFLKVFGCMMDVAVDGVAAVNTMNLEKYDQVLMVSISAGFFLFFLSFFFFFLEFLVSLSMTLITLLFFFRIGRVKLDGVSITKLIRKFDPGTPIVSMMRNSKPNKIMTYYFSGINDILPKPFTKEELLDMLDIQSASQLILD